MLSHCIISFQDGLEGTKNTFQEILGRNCRFLIDPVPPEQIDVTIRRHCRDFCNAVAVGKEYSIWLVISNVSFFTFFFLEKKTVRPLNELDFNCTFFSSVVVLRMTSKMTVIGTWLVNYFLFYTVHPIKILI